MDQNTNNLIEVRFFEGNNNQPFAVSSVPVNQLPDTFEINTTLHLGNDDWQVLAAEPAQKEEFRQSGRLNLYLNKQEMVQIDPHELLYSLPTINDEIASVETANLLENIAVFHEDDWRQFEFIDHQYELFIIEELNDINHIYENCRKGAGFTSLHIRRKITSPLNNQQLTLDDIQHHFGVDKKYNAAAFSNVAATIINSFSFLTKSGWLFWGQVNDSGIVTVLNLAQTKKSNVIEITNQMDSFLEKYKLYLLDWPRLFVCGQNQSSFAVYDEN